MDSYKKFFISLLIEIILVSTFFPFIESNIINKFNYYLYIFKFSYFY